MNYNLVMDVKSQIIDAIAADQNEMLVFTEDLVAIATENPPGTQYEACIDILTRKLDEINLAYEVITVPNPEGDKYPRYYFLRGYGEGEQVLYFHLCD